MKIKVTVPASLLSEVDALVGRGGRSAFFERAARNGLKRERLRLALDVARGGMAGTPGWRSSGEIIQFVDGLRSDDRDPWAS